MKKKVLFILPSIVAGGAERVITFISQNLDSDSFDSTLLIINKKTPNDYELNNELKTIFLNKNRVLNSVPMLFTSILKMKPNIVLCSISHLNIIIAIISCFFPNTKFIAREATVIGERQQNKNIKDLFYNKLLKITYPLLDRIICQSEDMRIDLISNYKIPTKKIVIINNPITNETSRIELKKRKFNVGLVKFITVGRLVPIKGHLRILKVLSQVTYKFTYTIIGDGPLKNEIFRTVEEYNMNEKITVIPYTKNVSSYLYQSDVFLQGSYVEGFPNALLESCAVGTPVIAFDAPGGTKEIIENDVNGYMVKDEQVYLNTLNNLKEFDPLKVAKSVQVKFNKKIILKQYEKLFRDVLN